MNEVPVKPIEECSRLICSGYGAVAQSGKHMLENVDPQLPAPPINTGDSAQAHGHSAGDAAVTSIGLFVERLYDVLLGRPADAEGLSYWVGDLSARTETVGTVVEHFVSSSEFA